MRVTVLLLLSFIIGSLLLLLSGCGGASTPPTPYNELDVYSINVAVQTAPQVDVHQHFQVSARIASSYHFAALSGIFIDANHKPPDGILRDLLQPSPSVKDKVKTFAFCMDVALILDDPFVATINEKSTPTIQEFTIEQDGTKLPSSGSQTVSITWDIISNDTNGRESVPLNMAVDVAFDAKASCTSAEVSLLGTSYHLVGTAHNRVVPATITINNPTLIQEREFVNARKTIVEVALPVLFGGLLSWASGFFSWVVNRIKVGVPSGSIHPTPVMQQKMQIAKSRRTSCIIGIVLGAIALAGGLLFIFLGPSTIMGFYTSTITALVGIALIVVGTFLIKT